MPRWQIQGPDGALMEIEGDTMPTESDLDALFAPTPTAPPKAPEQPPTPAIPSAPVEAPEIRPPDVTIPQPVGRYTSTYSGTFAPASLAPRAGEDVPWPEIPAPGRDTVEKALAAPSNAIRDWLESRPDSEDHPVMEKIAKSMTPSDKAVDAATGLAESATNTANFFVSPTGIALLGTAGIGDVAILGVAAQRILALSFAEQLASQVPEIANQLGDELGKPEDERDYQKISRLIADGAQATAFSAAGALHGLRAGADMPIVRSGELQGPPQIGAALPPPAARGVPVSVGTTALPGLADRIAFEMDQAAKAAQQGEPPPPAPKIVPKPPLSRAYPPNVSAADVPGEGEPIPPEPAPTPEQGPAAPPVTWDDFVAELKRRGRPDMTRAEIQSLFPDQRPTREAARDLAKAAFGDDWRPGGGAEPTPPPGAPPPPEPDLGAKKIGTVGGKDIYQFSTGKTEAGMEMDRVYVPAGSPPDVVRAAIEKRKAQVAKDFAPEHELGKQSVDDLIAASPEQFLAWQKGGNDQMKLAWAKAKETLGQNLSTEDAQKLQKYLDEYNRVLLARMSGIEKLQADAKAEPDPVKQKPLMEKWLAALNKHQQDYIKANTIQDILHFSNRPQGPPEPEATTAFDPSQVPTQEVPIASITVQRDVPNFKSGADPVIGVVPSERLKAGRYERVGTAPIVIWRKLNGELEVITGRTRLDLATRLGEKTIPAQIVEESKGFTKHMAMTLDAESNIRDGQGSVQDYANYFKGSPDLTEEEATSRGLLSRAKGKAGWDLAKTASDDLYALWQADKISESRALAIARSAPGDAAKQQLGIKLAGEGRDPEYIRARLERERAKAESPVQTDMFGNPVFDDAKADEEAGRVVQIRQDLRDQIRAVQSAAKNPEAAAKLGVDVKDPAGVLKKVEELKAELEKWEGAWWLDKDLVEKVKGQAPEPPQAPTTPEPPKPETVETTPSASTTPPPEPKQPFFKPDQQAKVDELKRKLRERLGGTGGGGVASTFIPGFDPELFNLGSDLAVEYIKAGVRKFGDFATHMIRDLGEKAKDYLLSWYSNARIQLKDIAHELDSEPDAEAEWNKRFGSKGTAGREISGPVGGSGQPGGRPGIRISRKELIPEPRQYVDANSYAKGSDLGLGQRPFILDPEQVRGINLALDRFVKNPVRGAFVLADGTGFGKTAQLLAIADQYIKRFGGKGVTWEDRARNFWENADSGAREKWLPGDPHHAHLSYWDELDPQRKRIAAKNLGIDVNAPAGPARPPRVLIVTKNKQIAQIRFGGDADAMGIPQKSYTITTYTGLNKIPPGQWDLVLFDEAHNLKNADSLKAIRAQRLDAKHTVFATATPMDKPTAAAYFLSEITGRNEHDIARDMGYTLVEREDPETHNTYQAPVLLPGFSWAKVWSNIMNHRDAAIRDGALVRREYPFFGKVDVEKMDMTPEDVQEHNQIQDHIDALIKTVRSPTAKRNFSGQKTLQLSRWSEQAKLQHAVDLAIAHVEKGGQAIIVAETDKDQSFWQPIRNAIRSEMRTSEETGRTRQVWIAEGAITQMKKMLADRGYSDVADIHDPKSNDIRLQVREFQAGRKRIALATPQSGGTGIDLDDQTGNRPRLMVALSKNMAGDDFEQLVGRVSRKNTQSPAQVTFLDLAGAFGDQRRNQILATKIRTLKAIQGGEDIDVAGRERQQGEPPQKGPGGELYSGLPVQAVVRSMRYVANDIGRIYDEVTSALGFKEGNPLSTAWRQFSMQSLPKITDSNRLAGEAGVRYAVSPIVARSKGLTFAENVTEGVRQSDFDQKFGTGLTEDNLRDLKRQWNERADEAEDRHEIIDSIKEQIAELKDAADDGDADAIRSISRMRQEIRRLRALTDEHAAIFRERANNVTTMIGADNSPFRTEAEYRAFMDNPETQQAINRHIERWRVEKDPLYREASDIDPDIEELPTRGLDYGARINLKDISREQATPTAVGGVHAPRSRFINPRATLRRYNPFAQAATGAGTYEGSYKEIMANGFGKEYPVAKQHEFIRQLVRGGDAKITPNAVEPELELKGEGTQPYLLTRGPWKGKTLHVRKGLAQEYEDASGLSSERTWGIYSKVGEFLTRMSVQGLAEGSTHVSNLLSQVFTGLGPTSDPLINTLLKTMGRSDLLFSLPKVFINAFSDRKADMLKLAEIGSAKEPYRGSVGWFITKIDQGVRLYAADVYLGMAQKGWVPDTETGLREFVNQVGQYNKRLQPYWLRNLRSTQVQPFATAVQTFNVGGLRTLTASPGAKGASNMAAIGLRADKAASILGFAVLVGGINYLLSGSITGPPGTRLGEIGWKDEKGQLKKIDVGALSGITRGARITGLQGYVESKRSGLDTGAALMSGAQGIGRAGLSYLTGPLNRFAFMSATGKRPDVPMSTSQFNRMQEAKVVPPQKEENFSPLKTQMAANILEAAKQANPLVDFATRATRGQYQEGAQRQFQRYYPRTGASDETIKNLPKIVQASELNAYADALAIEARKLTRGHLRNEFVTQRIKDDELDVGLRNQVMQRLRRDGVFTR